MSKKINDDSHVRDKFDEHNSIVSPNIELEKRKEERRKRKEELMESMGMYIPEITTLSGEKKSVNDLNIEEQEVEIIRCTKDPIYFICTYLTIFDQTRGSNGEIAPFKLFPFQIDLINTYVAERFVVANKYRQAGISTCTSAYISWYISFNENRNVAIVADKLETAMSEMMKDVVDFLAFCPEWLVPQPTLKNTQKYKIFSNGNELRAFASNSLRGFTPTLLFWDETAWAEKGDRFWTAARPSLQTGGRAIFVSCVTKDSFVFTKKGIKQVKEFIKTEELGSHHIDDVNLLGTHKIRKSNISFNNGYVDTLKIKTSYSELESSKNHKYWVYKNGTYNWFKASELNVGDYVSIQKGMNLWGSNDDCGDFKPTESHHIRNIFKPTKITKDIAYLIGLYISEGYFRRIYNRKSGGQLIITCGDDVSKTYKQLNLPFTCSDGLHYITSSYHLLEFFEYLGFDLSKKAPQKIIPSRVLEMSRDNIVAMMQGIMDGDGWTSCNVKRNKLRVGIGLSSLDLIKQIRIIFNNFGILTEYQEVLTPPTKLVKVESMQYRITANNGYAKKYFEEIGFKFERKQNVFNDYDKTKIKHVGVFDNLPNGSDVINEIFKEIKYYGIHNKLEENNINIKELVQRKRKISNPSSRKTILKLIELENENIPKEFFDKYNYIINDNIVWTKIKSIEKSKNYTYDFSMSNDNEEEWNEHHMSLIYNGLITHQTPNGLEPVFYKTFIGAKNKANENNFFAFELWWYNDPRYTRHVDTGEFDLEWIKYKGKEKEIRIKDEHWSHEKRRQLVEDGWEATSTWFELQVKDYNGDDKKLAQELLCVFGNSIITIKNNLTNIIEEITVETFYKRLEEENNSCKYL